MLLFRAARQRAVFGPGLPPADFPWMSRSADAIVAFLPLFTDPHGNASTFFRTESGSTRLFLGDRSVGESPEAGFGVFPGLPPAPGEYRLATEATSSHTGLSTSVSAGWTFQSSHVAGGAEKPLDLNVVRFAPKLDANGSAPAGRPFLVPPRVQDESGATSVSLRASATDWDDNTVRQTLIRPTGYGDRPIVGAARAAYVGWEGFFGARAGGRRG